MSLCRPSEDQSEHCLQVNKCGSDARKLRDDLDMNSRSKVLDEGLRSADWAALVDRRRMEQFQKTSPIAESVDDVVRSAEWARTLVNLTPAGEIADEDRTSKVPRLFRDPSTGTTYSRLIILPPEERRREHTSNQNWETMLRTAYHYREHAAVAKVIGIKAEEGKYPHTIFVEHLAGSVTFKKWVDSNCSGFEEAKTRAMFVPVLKLIMAMIERQDDRDVGQQRIGFPTPDFFVTQLSILPNGQLQYCYQPHTPGPYEGAMDNVFTMPPETVKAQVNRMTAQQWSWALGVLLFTLLTGNLPFTSTSFLELAYNITTANVDYSKLESRNVSHDVQDLLRRVLVVDHLQRLSLRDMLDHPWMEMNLEQHP